MSFLEKLSVGAKDRLARSLGIPFLRRYKFEPGSPKRVMLYTASNVGLGHLFRLLRVSRQLRRLVPDLNVMLITDTEHLAVTQTYGELSVLRLPNFTFQENSFIERPVGLEIGKGKLRALRINVMLAAIHSFRPHVLLMDTTPHGKRNELKPVLRYLDARADRPVRIVQVRDIPFVPSEYKNAKDQKNKLRDDMGLYDYVFVAGDPKYFDLVKSYQWPESMAEKLLYLGFIVPDVSAPQPDPAQPDRIDQMLGQTARRIVVSFGGGWEAGPLGESIITAYLELTERSDGALQLFIFTGPSTEDRTVTHLRSLAQGRADVHIEKFSHKFSQLLSRCDLAILQAGSSPFQILESDIPILIYARDFKSQEQQYRAEQFFKCDGIEKFGEGRVSKEQALERMEHMLAAPRRLRRTGFSFDGVERAAGAIAMMLNQSGKPARPPIGELRRASVMSGAGSATSPPGSSGPDSPASDANPTSPPSSRPTAPR